MQLQATGQNKINKLQTQKLLSSKQPHEANGLQCLPTANVTHLLDNTVIQDMTQCSHQKEKERKKIIIIKKGSDLMDLKQMHQKIIYNAEEPNSQ